MSGNSVADTTKAASLVAGKLSYDFNDMSNLETAVRLPDRSDQENRQADDGNRRLARIGREATQLAVSMQAQQNGESREAASSAIDSRSAHDERIDAAKRMGLSELLVRSPRQSKTELSSRVLERSIFAIAGAICFDSGGDISSVSQCMHDMISPNSSHRPRSRSLPASSVRRKTGSSRLGSLNRTVSLQQLQESTCPYLEDYIRREERLCKKWTVQNPREELRRLESLTTNGQSLSAQDKVTQRLLFFAFGSQEAVLWLCDVVREYSSGFYRYAGMGWDTRAHFEQIQKLSAQSALFILLKRLHTYLFYQSIDESVRRPLQDFLPADESRPRLAGNPRNRALGALVDTILSNFLPPSSSDRERRLLRTRIASVCKQALNLDRIVQQWGLGALVLFKGSTSPTYSDCELTVSDEMLGGIAFETFRTMVTNLNTAKGPLFGSMANMFQRLVDDILQGRDLHLGGPFANKSLFLDLPRDLPEYAEEVRRIVQG